MRPQFGATELQQASLTHASRPLRLQAAHKLRPAANPARARGQGAAPSAASSPARIDALAWLQASIKALTQHVSLVDHVAHEQLLLKARRFGTRALADATDASPFSCLRRACGTLRPTSRRLSPSLLSRWYGPRRAGTLLSRQTAAVLTRYRQVSANTACLHGCIDVLVSNFTPPALSPGVLHAANLPAVSGARFSRACAPASDKAVDHSSRALQSQTVLHQVHSALGKVCPSRVLAATGAP